MSIKEVATEQLKEISMIEMAYRILNNNKQAATFQEIWEEIIKITGMSEEEARTRIAQFYTDINIDGRFIALGENRWGLRSWYPVDQLEDDSVAPAKSKKKSKKNKKDVKKEEPADFVKQEKEEIELAEEEIDDLDDLDEEDEDLDDLLDDEDLEELGEDAELDDDEEDDDEEDEEEENVQY